MKLAKDILNDMYIKLGSVEQQIMEVQNCAGVALIHIRQTKREVEDGFRRVCEDAEEATESLERNAQDAREKTSPEQALAQHEMLRGHSAPSTANKGD